MNEGIIASRYAGAFLQLVLEHGSGASVVPQARAMLRLVERLPQQEFSTACRSEMKAEAIVAMFGKALGNVPLEKDLCSFISLLVSNGRTALLREALRSFLSENYRHEGIRCGVLTVARADESLPVLEARLRTLVQNEFGCTLELETREDPSIVGGFVFALEDYLLDASVRRKLDVIRKRYVENNRRLI